MYKKFQEIRADYEFVAGMVMFLGKIISDCQRFYQINKFVPLEDIEMSLGFFLVVILPTLLLGIALMRVAIRDAKWRKTELRPVREHYEKRIKIIKQEAIRAKKILAKVREPLGDFFEYGGVMLEVEMHNPNHHQVRETCRLRGHIICPKCKTEFKAVKIKGEFQWWCQKCEHKAKLRGSHGQLHEIASFRFRQKLDEIEAKLFRKKTQK